MRTEIPSQPSVNNGGKHYHDMKDFNFFLANNKDYFEGHMHLEVGKLFICLCRGCQMRRHLTNAAC